MPKTIIDISRTISNEALVYPGDASIDLSPEYEIYQTCSCRITKLENWTTHFLTHVDAPCHFDENGASLDEIPLKRFMGKTLVVEVNVDAINANVIDQFDFPSGLNVLFKTRHSIPQQGSAFDKNHVFITSCGAKALIERGVNLVGIDYLSVDAYGDETFPAHRTLLGNNVLILENVNLSAVQPGLYNLMALPLKIEGGDGSPVRAVLMPSY
jgi:arylformamidase